MTFKTLKMMMRIATKKWARADKGDIRNNPVESAC